MPKFSTAVPQSSTLTVLYFLGLLGVLQEYAEEPFVARLVIAAPAALRHDNLCITRARQKVSSNSLR